MSHLNEGAAVHHADRVFVVVAAQHRKENGDSRSNNGQTTRENNGGYLRERGGEQRGRVSGMNTPQDLKQRRIEHVVYFRLPIPIPPHLLANQKTEMQRQEREAGRGFSSLAKTVVIVVVKRHLRWKWPENHAFTLPYLRHILTKCRRSLSPTLVDRRKQDERGRTSTKKRQGGNKLYAINKTNTPTKKTKTNYVGTS